MMVGIMFVSDLRIKQKSSVTKKISVTKALNEHKKFDIVT